LDILSARSDVQDLKRIREAVKDEKISYSPADIRYLGRHGEWQDIPLIITAVEKKGGSGLLVSRWTNEEFQIGARSILIIAAQRFEELVTLPMPSKLLELVLRYATDRQVRELNDVAINKLFDSTSDFVRKTTILRCIRALPKKRLTKMFSDYRNHKTRYYNIIYWFDICAHHQVLRTYFVLCSGRQLWERERHVWLYSF